MKNFSGINFVDDEFGFDEISEFENTYEWVNKLHFYWLFYFYLFEIR